MAKKRNNTRIANLTLAGIALGFLLSYPFQGSFLGGLIASGCRAGMIGGLADWFAVTALFRRPLGIRPGRIIRTEIIPQNRERIFAALADMVQNELLSQEVLAKKLAALDFSDLLVRALHKEEIRLTAGAFLTDLADEADKRLGEGTLTEDFSSLLQENLEKLDLSQTLAEVIEFTVERGEEELFFKGICEAIREYVEQPEVKVALMQTIEAGLSRYAESNLTRRMVIKFVPEPSILAHDMQEKLKTVLQDGTAEDWLQMYLARLVLDLKTDPELQEKVNGLCRRLLVKGLVALEKEQGAFGDSHKKKAPIAYLTKQFVSRWEEYLARYADNTSLSAAVNENVRTFLEKQIAARHEVIGRMVYEGLSPLTNDEIVELLEDKAGNDLQMIRINGSVVGGLVGMLIYVAGVVLR